MNLFKASALNYNASYSYSPPEMDVVFNLNEVVSAVVCESRSSRPTMLVRFKDGSHLTVVGKPDDLIVKEAKSLCSECLKEAQGLIIRCKQHNPGK